MGPFKCPDCGIWWAGFEHRCRIETSAPTTTKANFVVFCTCPTYPPNYIGDVIQNPTCPVHRYGWTFTGGWWDSTTEWRSEP